MIALWLIEFLLIALIGIALAWAVQQMIARARSREREQSYAQELMRYDEDAVGAGRRQSKARTLE